MRTTTMQSAALRKAHDSPVGSSEDITAEVITITPEMAEFYLTKNRCNRPLSERAVTDYALAMSQGYWDHINGEAIIFGADDSLIDGQHRLHAICKSQQPIGCLVVTGIDPAKRRSVDTGKKRSLGNYLSMLGYVQTTTLSAAMTWVWSYEQGLIETRSTNVRFVSHEAAIGFLEQHPTLPSSVPHGRSMQPLFAPGLGTFLHYLFAQQDAPLAEVFAQGIAKGITSEQSQPFYALRERLIRERGTRKKVRQVDLAVYAIRAWNAQRQKKTIHVFRWAREAPNIEAFPQAI
jgi:hypothetical protein